MSIFIKSNASASDSQRLNEDHIAMINNPKMVDSVSTFTECGWFCILAFKNSVRVLYAHCDSREDYERMLDPIAYYKKKYGTDEFGCDYDNYG
jgi:hypothetical protein